MLAAYFNGARSRHTVVRSGANSEDPSIIVGFWSNADVRTIEESIIFTAAS